MVHFGKKGHFECIPAGDPFLDAKKPKIPPNNIPLLRFYTAVQITTPWGYHSEGFMVSVDSLTLCGLFSAVSPCVGMALTPCAVRQSVALGARLPVGGLAGRGVRCPGPTPGRGGRWGRASSPRCAPRANQHITERFVQI